MSFVVYNYDRMQLLLLANICYVYFFSASNDLIVAIIMVMIVAEHKTSELHFKFIINEFQTLLLLDILYTIIANY